MHKEMSFEGLVPVVSLLWMSFGMAEQADRHRSRWVNCFPSPGELPELNMSVHLRNIHEHDHLQGG